MLTLPTPTHLGKLGLLVQRNMLVVQMLFPKPGLHDLSGTLITVEHAEVDVHQTNILNISPMTMIYRTSCQMHQCILIT